MGVHSDITVTLECNNACLFCPRTTLAHIHAYGEADLDRRLRKLALSSRRVTLSGGEVTVLADPVALVAKCRDLGFAEIAIITNGRRLADDNLTRRMVEAGLTEACVTVYDLRPRVHDSVTRSPGSLVETLRGLDNLLAAASSGAPLSVRVNTNLFRGNADGIVAMLRGLAERGVQGFLVADVVLSDEFPHPLGYDRVVAIARQAASEPALARRSISWRGFPLCIFRGVAGIRAEPQDVDTTTSDPLTLDAYFSEFLENFCHVEACSRCGESTRCPGVQKRHMQTLGTGSISPISDPCSPDVLERDLAQFPPWPDHGRLEVMPTTACQLRCTYCNVELGRRNAPPEVLDASVDLLLRSERDRLELQFFGGEPLLRRREVVRTMERGAALAKAAGKRLHFRVTTNGLLLDREMLDVLKAHDSSVLFSLDGPPDVMERFRPPASGSSAVAVRKIEHNLRALVASGVPYFVNMVVSPDCASDMERRVRYIAHLGARTIQICNTLGSGWTRGARAVFRDGLERCAKLVGSPSEGNPVPLRIQNFHGSMEPVVLGNDMLVDVDGTLYGDGALFGEKVFPGLRRGYRIGRVQDLASFDGLRRSREQNLAALRSTFAPGTEARTIIEQHLLMGREIHRTLESIGLEAPASAPYGSQSRFHRQSRASGPSDHNPIHRTFILRDLAGQAALVRRRPEAFRLPLLLLENPCCHDCVFCKSKPLAPTPLDRVERWLEGNDELGLSRLGLVGNEPLAHPQIDAIIAMARRHGFEHFDVLTTGRPLEEPDRARQLVEAGITGFSIPLYSTHPVIHDEITRATGSHAGTLRAIRNLTGPVTRTPDRRGESGTGRGAGRVRVHIHTNLLRYNLDGLGDLERFVTQDLGLEFCVIPVRPKDSNIPWQELVPPYPEIAARCKARSLVAFPLCVCSRVQDPAVPDSSIISDVLKVYVLDQPFVKPPTCAPCSMRQRCAGTFQAYLDLYGDTHLTAFASGKTG